MANTYLTRTASATATTFTYSAWIKRSGLASDFQYFFSYQSSGGGSNAYGLAFNDTTNKMYYYGTGGTATTDAVFRDSAAWYHVVLSVSSGTGTLYVNGETVKSSISVNQVTSGEGMTLGAYKYGSTVDYQFDGYMSETHFTDGTAYAPTTFGQTNTDGVWVPKIGPSVTYGTNGFYLKFENSGAMGTDSSGNSNTFSVGAGTVRQVPDSPTNVFATLNPNNISGGSLINGNLYYSNGNSWSNGVTGTQSFPAGKWYWEARVGGNYWFIGIQDVDSEQSADTANGPYKWTYAQNAKKYNNTIYLDYGATYAANDIISVAYDADNGTLTFYKNGSSQGVAYSGLDTSKRYTAFVNCYGSNLNLNFGQNGTFNGTVTAQGNADGNGKGDFYYAPPTGFLALCTDNLSSELTLPIGKGDSYFNTLLWSGDDSTRNITGVGFAPDWVWIKSRSDSAGHVAFDTVRGASKRLVPNSSGAGTTTNEYGFVTAFGSDGFTLTPGNQGAYASGDTNMTGRTYVGWNWKAGGTAPANTYAVKVVSDSGNKYRFDDYGTSAITLELQEGGTFTFDQSDASNSGHPIRFSTTADGTHGGGSEYTTGVTTNGTPGQSGAYTRITVAASAPTLYYYCSVHSGMGGQANTGSLFGFTNVKGSIQSVVSPNSTAGFSVVTYTGTGANATVGHGLGKAPNLVIVKLRSGTGSWAVYSRAVGATKVAYLESTTAFFVNSSFWNNTDPTSSVFSLGSEATTNTNGGTLVAYCFADIEGYSKIGSYTGNASTDGPFIYTGFKPSWVMIKRIDGANGWNIFDSARNPTNVVEKQLFANSSAAEEADAAHNAARDYLSNGFKIRETGNDVNVNGSSYLYMAFAENPLVTSTGTPVTAG